MILSYHTLIAFRYLKSRKRRKTISLSTIISLGGVAVGVMALVTVLAVMSGFHDDLRRKILGVTTHVVTLSFDGTIKDYGKAVEKIKGIQHVAAVSPFVVGQVMLSHAKAARGVFLRGVIPGLEKDTTDIAKYVFKGSLEGLSTEPYGIVIGRELSTNLNLHPGDEVTVISPVGDIGPLGMIPKTRNFKVVAVFEVGMFEYDSSLVVTSLKAAQEFFDMGDQVSGIEAKVDDIYLASSVKEEINLKLGYPLFARDWMQMNKNLFAALKLEKLAMFVILTLIVLVAAFNIVSTLTMNVMEKEREIAILKTMGATNGGIMAIFMLQGFLIGLAGTLLGLAGGGALCYALDTYKIIKLPADVYYLSSLPVKINLLDFTVVAVSAILISFFSTVYPAWQAAKLEPVEALRFE